MDKKGRLGFLRDFGHRGYLPWTSLYVFIVSRLIGSFQGGGQNLMLLDCLVAGMPECDRFSTGPIRGDSTQEAVMGGAVPTLGRLSLLGMTGRCPSSGATMEVSGVWSQAGHAEQTWQ